MNYIKKITYEQTSWSEPERTMTFGNIIARFTRSLAGDTNNCTILLNDEILLEETSISTKKEFLENIKGEYNSSDFHRIRTFVDTLEAYTNSGVKSYTTKLYTHFKEDGCDRFPPGRIYAVRFDDDDPNGLGEIYDTHGDFSHFNPNDQVYNKHWVEIKINLDTSKN